MGLPVVAVVGRPNVGKSTFVNRLAGSMDAIVHDQPGMTRDRTYRPAFWQDREFLVVDTGGLVFDDDSEFLPHIRQQVGVALSEANVVILVVDGQAGVNAADIEVAQWLRQQSTPVLVAVNKCESVQQGLAQAAEFWELGLGEPWPLSSIHGSGTGDLLDAVLAYLPPPESIEEVAETRVAIVGRPNVGKSSLLNAFVGETRSIVSPISGTTRDAIDTVVERQGKRYRFIDTAGIRRKKHVDYGPEFFGINRAFKAIRRADVVLLVIDALDSVTDQDQKLAGRIVEEGRACVLVVNKWDAVEKDTYTMNVVEQEVRSRLLFMDWAPAIFVSAHSGQRVEKILSLVDQVVGQHQRRVSTAVINEVLAEALRWHTPPTSRQGRQGKIYYGTQVSHQPPAIVLFVNNPDHFKDNYRRYIERQFREALGFTGTPIRLMWRGKKEREVERNSTNRATRA
ncbi:ribosome biogenesis GTPase Der [Synechococcales cyanobacterium C]|uniref:GTPase Der n=1 Tax=Petrachloros mirabilis ULC683 TaxID=2781853 RepID=A0A8K1ZZT5_9CYAN|nr:ribosome biogenesis GTPase Der [Petrachloros mirabilis]NCJ07137.1 ribosome biogenesis GTPase Der [Petrachloros mirabilis ULC683]